MLQLIQLNPGERESDVCLLFGAYVQWLHDEAEREYGIALEVDAVVQMFMMRLDDFYPPNGRMYLAAFDGEVVGIGCLKQLGEGVGEIKRMFVKPEYRGKGIGKGILDRLIAEAGAIGFTKMLLDSPKLSTVAHGLYQSRGFQYIEQYPGSEGAEAQSDLFIYMELVL